MAKKKVTKKLSASERVSNKTNRKSKVHPKTAKAMGDRLPGK